MACIKSPKEGLHLSMISLGGESMAEVCPETGSRTLGSRR